MHPGGPFWAGKEDGAWSIPKGLVDPGEDKLAAAKREFEEETSIPPCEPFIGLGEIRQKSGKRIFVSDYIEIRELAELLGVKPFKVVAEVLELRMFKHADGFIDFSTAVKIGQQHGFIVEKLL